MQIFFIGCTHFGHPGIIKLANRPFSSAQEMDEVMVERWNEVVRDGDVVYHLGDFAWRNPQAYLSVLRGTVVPVRGNHDPDNWGDDIIEITGFSRRLVLCHYPIEEWNGWYRDSLHVHAHTHSPVLASAPRRFNVSAEAVDYRPITLTDIFSHPNASRRAP